jgi:hypothetical protein
MYDTGLEAVVCAKLLSPHALTRERRRSGDIYKGRPPVYPV